MNLESIQTTISLGTEFDTDSQLQKFIEKGIEGNQCGDVNNAIQRFLEDFSKTNSSDSDFIYSSKHADFVVSFIEKLRHYKGKFANKKFKLLPWQKFIVANVFGFQRRTGGRRFRRSYIEVPKKNGKTTFMAALALYLAFYDNESAAEVYSAATKRDQAKIVFDDAKAMVRQNPVLVQNLKINLWAISNPRTFSKFLPLSSDYNTADGINPHAAIIDELHRHTKPDMVDLLSASTSGRSNPLIFEITTAGDNVEGVCYEHHTFTKKVNANVLKDEEWFGMVFSIDEGDDITNEKSWFKSNPSLGHSKSVEYLRKEVDRSKKIRRVENYVKRYDFNIWSYGSSNWIDIEKWIKLEEGKTDSELTNGDYDVYCGIDLASKKDFNAVGFLFVPEDKTKNKYIKTYVYIPKNAYQQRLAESKVNLQLWIESGDLNVIDSDVMDMDILGEAVRNLIIKYKPLSVGYDPYLATHGVIRKLVLKDVNVEEVAQNYKNMSDSFKTFEADILAGKLNHDGNKCSTWMVSNVHLYTDPNENIKLKKIHTSSENKIDAVLAVTIAYNRFLENISSEEKFNNLYRGDNFKIGTY